MTGISKDEIVPVLFLTIVVCVAVIALTITNSITKDLIEEQKEIEIKENLEKLFPEMDDFEEDDDEEFYIVYQGNNLTNGTVIGFAFTVEGEGYGGTIEMLAGIEAYSYLATERIGGQEFSYTVTPDFEPAADNWTESEFPNGTKVFEVDDNNGSYKIFVERSPLNETEIDMVTLRGLRIVFHAETPGLGAKITDDDFLNQFKGIALGDLSLTADGGEVDAISGATISSEAVTDGVYDTVKSKVKKISKWLEEVDA